MAAPTWNQPAPAQCRGQSRRGCRRSHCGPAHRDRSASSLLICRDSSTSFQRGPINGCRSQPAHCPAPGSALSCHGPAHRRTIRGSGAAPWTASAPPERHPSAPDPCATTGNPRLAATARSPPQMKVGCHPPARPADPTFRYPSDRAGALRRRSKHPEFEPCLFAHPLRPPRG